MDFKKLNAEINEELAKEQRVEMKNKLMEKTKKSYHRMGQLMRAVQKVRCFFGKHLYCSYDFADGTFCPSCKRQWVGEKGFTIIETIIAAMIFGILVALTIPQFQQYQERKLKIEKLEQEIGQEKGLITQRR